MMYWKKSPSALHHERTMKNRGDISFEFGLLKERQHRANVFFWDAIFFASVPGSANSTPALES
jgi:hypothetical protein